VLRLVVFYVTGKSPVKADGVVWLLLLVRKLISGRFLCQTLEFEHGCSRVGLSENG